MRRTALILALALLATPAAAQPLPPIEDAQRAALMRVLRFVGVEVGAVWPVGDLVYQVEEIRIERNRAGEVTITVKTRLLR